jgi:crotonobetainyl-CoA:carnitine CoA-transferase CaiB-like acyl-CoA transferase
MAGLLLAGGDMLLIAVGTLVFNNGLVMKGGLPSLTLRRLRTEFSRHQERRSLDGQLTRRLSHTSTKSVVASHALAAEVDLKHPQSVGRIVWPP